MTSPCLICISLVINNIGQFPYISFFFSVFKRSYLYLQIILICKKTLFSKGLSLLTYLLQVPFPRLALAFELLCLVGTIKTKVLSFT